MDDKQLAMVLTAITQGFERVAKAIESAREAQADETLQFALGDYKAFNWASIGAQVVDSDETGPSVIRAANGKLAKRRSNDKFGTEIWFSYADGKDEKGENRYRKVIEFRQVAAPEPLGRKTEQALAGAKPSAPQSQATAAKQAPATPPVQPDPRVAALNALNLIINEATLEGVDLTTATKPQDGDDAATLNMRASTLRNLIDAKKRSGAPPETQSAGNADRGEQVVLWLQGEAKRVGNKTSTPAQDAQTVTVLQTLAGGVEGRQQFTEAVFMKPAFDRLLPSQRLALWHWLKPIGDGEHAKTDNPKAAGSVRDVLAYAVKHKQLVGQAA